MTQLPDPFGVQPSGESCLSLVKEDDMNQNEAPMGDDMNDANLNADNAANFEWEYSMRRQMQEIVPRLWLGPYASALKTKEDELCRVGVTHIICVRQQIEAHWIRPNFPLKYHYLTLDIADTPTQNIIQYFPSVCQPTVPLMHSCLICLSIDPKVTKFIDDCFERNGAVLVHGNAGISRSAALVIAYIMEKQNLSASQAIRVVQNKRFCIFPNEGFRQQLQEYEPILKARGIPLSSEGGLKRPFSEEDSENMDTNQFNSMDS
ncbi:unnamed protein product [Oppiella nova]|uniref:Uncharacterized protein n=1 Tax=Oppiella nova TaxID=334625 RepID=A0A7R9LGY4_9ACAR|nr:unnamed protein product [Oppiella nova]CAG2163485.1 unnamed protein product [Oppiella nova]